MQHCILTFVLFFIAAFNGIVCLENGLARKPPMGFLSWERYLCETDCDTYPDSCISEKLYSSMADVMAKEGYLQAGYEFVNIDDCWMAGKRDKDGTLQPDAKRFPHGIKWLADYVHSKGLKLGIYQVCGVKTCQGFPGSQGYFQKDADTYAKWGIDMLKLDGCNVGNKSYDDLYPAMQKALNKTGRKIVYSCSWPAYQGNPNYKNIAKYCNLWRYNGDIYDTQNSIIGIIDYYAKNQDRLIPYGSPGAWFDPDMLVVGNFGLSEDEAKSQMAIWAIMAAPLLISADLRKIKPEFKKILLNKEVIAIDQDEYGIMGKQVYNYGNIQIWTRPVGPKAHDGTMSAAIVVHSRHDSGSATLVSETLSKLGLKYEGGYVVNDLFEKQIVNKELKPSDRLSVRVNPSGVVMLKATVITKKKKSNKTRNVAVHKSHRF